MMSPEDIKYNYFFHEPADKVKKMSEYLHYSLEDDIYTAGEEDINFNTNDFVQNSAFSYPGYVWNKEEFEEYMLVDTLNFSGGTGFHEQVEKDSKNDENDFYSLEGNNRTDEEFNTEI